MSFSCLKTKNILFIFFMALMLCLTFGIGFQSPNSVNAAGVVSVNLSVNQTNITSVKVGDVDLATNASYQLNTDADFTFVVTPNVNYNEFAPTVSYRIDTGETKTLTSQTANGNSTYSYTIPQTEIANLVEGTSVALNISAHKAKVNLIVQTENASSTLSSKSAYELDINKDITFTVTPELSHNKVAPTVNYIIGSSGSPVPLTPDQESGSATYTYTIPSSALSSVTDDMQLTITITPQINTYTITAPTQTNFTFTQISASNTIQHNGTYQFIITPYDGYQIDSVTDGTNPIPCTNGIYTLTATKDTTIEVSVSGIQYSYNVILPSGDGYYITSSSTTPVVSGGSYSFTVNLQDAYSASAPVVEYSINGGIKQTLNATSQTTTQYNYTISNITGTVQIYVTATKQTYTINSTTPAGATVSYISGVSNSTVNHKSAISFKVELNKNYNQSTPQITYTVGSGQAQQPTITPSVAQGNSVYVCTIPANMVTGNISISVANVKPNTYNIEFNTSSGINITPTTQNLSIINGSGTITYNTSGAGFRIDLPTTNYQQLIAKYYLNNVEYQLTTGSGTTRSFTLPANNITGNIKVEIKIIVQITAPTQTNFTFERTDDNLYDNNLNLIEYGKTYKFTVVPNTGYKIDSVSAGGTVLNPQNNVYSFTANQSQTISVTPSKIQYSFTQPVVDDTYTFDLTSGVTSNQFNHGDVILFSITLKEGYTQSNPIVTFSVNGETATVLTSTGSSESNNQKTLNYEIADTQTTGNIQVFVSGIQSLTYTVGLMQGQSTYFNYEGVTSTQYQQEITFTLTLTSPYTQQNISENVIKYSVGGEDKGFLTGTRIANSSAYSFTIPANQVTNNILISANTTLAKNKYTITINNTLTTQHRSGFRQITVNNYTYSFNRDTYGSLNSTADTTQRIFEDIEHGTNISFIVNSYGTSSWGNTTYSEEQIVARNTDTNQRVIWTDSVVDNSSDYSTSLNGENGITNNWELTIEHKESYAYVYLPTLDTDYITSIPKNSNYSTQFAITENLDEPVNPEENRATHVGYTITPTSGELWTQDGIQCYQITNGNQFSFSVNVLTQYGYNADNLQVRYWTKNNSNNYSTNGIVLNPSGSTYTIYFNNTSINSFYISVTGITRNAYDVSLPTGNGFSAQATTQTPVTYADTYTFNLNIDTANGWYIGSSGLKISYTVNGGAIQTLRTENADSGTSFTYNLKITGRTVFYVEGLLQQTFNINAIYLDQNQQPYQSKDNVFETDFGGGTVIPASNLPIAYGGNFVFSLWINTIEGYNGTNAKVEYKIQGAGDTTYTTLTAVSGNYTISNITNHITLRISGITADSYYISFPSTQTGYSIQRNENYSSNSVLKNGNFEFNVTIITGEGYYAGENDANLRVYYYNNENMDNHDNWTLLTANRDENGVNNFIIENITENLFIAVEGLTQITYTITPPSYSSGQDQGCTFVDTDLNDLYQQVIYGGSYRFNVEVLTGYDASTLEVFYVIGTESEENPKRQIYKTGDYYIISNITNNVTISWTLPVKYTYTVTTPTNTEQNGYTFTAVTENIVEYGDSYRFRINILDSHQASTEAGISVTYTDSSNSTHSVSSQGGYYIIESVTSNITINVSNLERKTFVITLPSSRVGYSIISTTHTTSDDDTQIIVQYGEEYRFRISVDTSQGYQSSGAVVRIDNTSNLLPISGIYTLTDGETGITQSHTISITGVELSEYTITLPTTQTGYQIVSDDPQTVQYNGSYSFKVELLENYTKSSSFAVRYEMGGNNAVTIEPQDDTYTISNITSYVRITVTGVELNTYTVTLPNDEGYTIRAVSGTTVNVGSNFDFTVTINTSLGYYKSEDFKVGYQTSADNTLWSETQYISEGAQGIYSVPSITTYIKIVIEGVIKDSYRITLPTTQTGYSVTNENGIIYTNEMLSAVPYGEEFKFKVAIQTSGGYYKDEENFQVSYNLNNRTYILEAVDDIYTIPSVTNNIEIFIVGVELTYFTVYLPSNDEQIGYTLYTNYSTTVPYLGSFVWSIQPDTENGYMNNAKVTVKIYRNGEWVERDPQPSESNNTYTLNSINCDIKIEVTSPDKITRTVTLPTNQQGYSIEALSSTTVTYGENFQFKVNIDTQNGYDATSLTVRYSTNGVNFDTLTADDGIYTISNITTNISIEVTNIILTKVSINFTVPEGVTVYNSTGAVALQTTETTDYGTNFEFKLVLNTYYSNAMPTVYATVNDNTQVLPLNASNNYVIQNVTSTVEISIQGVEMNSADYTNLTQALSLTPPYPESYYTSNSWAAYQATLNVAKGIESNLKVNDQQNIDNAASNLKFAYEQLEIRTADYTQVNEVLKLVPSNLEEYTTASREALETAIATVKNDLDMTNQDIVNGYVEMISAAINGLAKQNQTVEEGIKPWIVYLIITLLVCFIIALIVIMVINSRKIKPVFVKNEFTTNLLKNEKENKKVSDEFSQNPFAKPTQKSIKENAQKAQSQPNTQINRTINNHAQSTQPYKPQNNINSQANTQQTQTPNNPMNSNQKPNKK